MKLFNCGVFILSIFFILACKNESNDNENINTNKFVCGADVSWLTEMEKSNIVFHDSLGQQKDCLHILKELGTNAIRLRVWVNPENGWCNANDVLQKAIRANNLNMKIMIDFHYSDSWADPSQQTKPAAWKGVNFADLKILLANHTKEVLTLLKNNGVKVDWVQIGNETRDGMLWEDGKASVNMQNYAALTTTGYDAVKEIFPAAKVIVHIDNGYDNSLYRWIFDGLTRYGAKFDVVGMSLYPTSTTWQTLNQQCLNNMNDMVSRYGKEVMICEVGMATSEATSCNAFLTDLIKKSKTVSGNKCLGIFYWEPEAYNGWKGYKLGAFDDSGKPTVALNAFKMK